MDIEAITAKATQFETDGTSAANVFGTAMVVICLAIIAYKWVMAALI